MSQTTVRIPAPLRSFTAGTAEVTVEGKTVGEVLRSLGETHRGLKGQILTEEGEVREFVNIFLGDRNIRSLRGLESPVAEAAVIHVVPAVAGGHHESQ